MRMLVAKVFTILAFSIILTHNLVPHHHHDIIEATDDHHHDDDHDHSLFTFGSVDDNFLLTKTHATVFNNFGSLLFFLPNPILISSVSQFEINREYSTYQEFPPPENYQLIASLRAPPIFC